MTFFLPIGSTAPTGPDRLVGAVSHGCFRMHNSHIIELYEKVQIGASVYVVP